MFTHVFGHELRLEVKSQFVGENGRELEMSRKQAARLRRGVLTVLE
jgi:hypothetical protein